jgi:hemoglobin/transferrin/lactoferrin receptor protein
MAPVQNAGAQESQTPQLPTVTVTAGSLPSEKEVIDNKRIAAEQPTTLNELFKNSPDVNVSGGNRSAAQKVYIRGVEDTSANVTIDGAKQGGNLYAHTGQPGIDPELLKRVEVKAGTGSALAGPGALGGSIAYETKDAEDMLLLGQTRGAMLKFSGQTNGSRATPAAAVYGTSEKFSYLLYGTKSWAKDYSDGEGNKVPDSDSEPLNSLLKLTFRPADGHKISLSQDNRQDNGFRAYRSNFGVPQTSPDAAPENQKLNRHSTSLRYNFSPAGNPLVDLTATAYDNRIQLKRLIADETTSEWFTRGFDLRNRSRLGRVVLTYGTDYTWDKSAGSTASGRYGSERATNVGVYTQADFALSDRWLLSGGLRHDSSKLTDLVGNEYDRTHLSPNAQLRFEPVGGVSLFASWSEAFRGVRPVEGLTLVRAQGLAANTDLSLPGEVARTKELGIDVNRDGWRGSLTGYITAVQDTVLYWENSRLPFRRRDGGDLDIKGFTARLGRSWDNWTVDLSYAHSRIKNNGQPISPSNWLAGYTPQGDRLGVSIARSLLVQNLTVMWSSSFVQAIKDLPSSYALPKVPGYAVHDIAAVWRPSKGQEYSVAVTNLFNKHYLDQATPFFVTGGTTSLYEMGRSLRVAATFRF